MSTVAVTTDSNYKRNADPLRMERIGIEFKRPLHATFHAT
jgi:hypothetical protein